jgi:hypothetical protein
MSASSDSADAALERRDRLRALALESMLTRLKVPVDEQNVLLVSDRPGSYDERLLARGGFVFRRPSAQLNSGPPNPILGESGPFGLVLWLDGGPESPASMEFERSLVSLARSLAPGGWLGLALAASPAPAGPDDLEALGWGHWATTLWSCGLTVHDVRVTQHFGGPGARVPAWLRPFSGFAYRLDRGLVMSGLRLGGSGPRLVMARRRPTILPSGNS